MIFLDVNLPNATTWFYFSGLLAVALFFKFTRLLSVRNLDVLGAFLLVPGFLLLLEGGDQSRLGYAWLYVSSVLLFARCLADLALVRRPALSPNLSLSGLAWLMGALFVSLIAVAVRQPVVRETSRPGPNPLELPEKQVESLGSRVKGIPDLPAEVTEADSDYWVGRTLAILCHLSVVVGVILIGGLLFRDVHAGMAIATFYLLLPYTYLLLPSSALHIGQWDHIWPMALMVWAILCYRWPTFAGLLLGIAAGTVYFAIVLFPVWLSFYWRRGAGRFVAAFLLAAGVCLGFIGVNWLMTGELPQSLQAALSDWQPWKQPATEGFWTAVSWVYRIPVFIAYVAFLLTTAFWPAPKNLAHLLALSAAVLIGLPFWYGVQGGIYVLWYLPLVLLLAFRPNLEDRRPLPIVSETDWLSRLGRALGRLVVRVLGPQQPAISVR